MHPNRFWEEIGKANSKLMGIIRLKPIPLSSIILCMLLLDGREQLMIQEL